MPKQPFQLLLPTNSQNQEIDTVRLACKELYGVLLTCKPCRERSLAIGKLEEVLMWASKGIAMQEEEPGA